MVPHSLVPHCFISSAMETRNEGENTARESICAGTKRTFSLLIYLLCYVRDLDQVEPGR